MSQELEEDIRDKESFRLAGIDKILKELDKKYEACDKPIDNEVYHLIRNIAKYIIEDNVKSNKSREGD